MWCWVISNRSNGTIPHDTTNQELADICYYSGDPDKLFDALQASKCLDGTTVTHLYEYIEQVTTKEIPGTKQKKREYRLKNAPPDTDIHPSIASMEVAEEKRRRDTPNYNLVAPDPLNVLQYTELLTLFPHQEETIYEAALIAAKNGVKPGPGAKNYIKTVCKGILSERVQYDEDERQRKNTVEAQAGRIADGSGEWQNREPVSPEMIENMVMGALGQNEPGENTAPSP